MTFVKSALSVHFFGVWNGGSWQTLFSDLSSGWQNVSVSPYLDSSNLTIRFKDGTGTGDTVQNSWEIDVALLRIWTVSDEYTAEVEFVGSSYLEDWTKLIWQIDSCWNVSTITVTVQFYNYTLYSYVTYLTDGDGYTSYVSDTTPDTDELKSQTITLSPGNFRNSTGHWKVKITGVKSTSTRFK